MAPDLRDHIRSFTAGHVGWFDMIDAAGFLDSALSSEDEAREQETVWMLSLAPILEARSARISELLLKYRKPSERWNQYLRHVCRSGSAFHSRDMFNWFLSLIDDGTLDGARPGIAINDDWWGILYSMSEKRPDLTCEAIAHWFDRRIAEWRSSREIADISSDQGEAWRSLKDKFQSRGHHGYVISQATKAPLSYAREEAEEYVEGRRSRYADALRALVEKTIAERAAATDKRPAEHRLKPIGASLAALDARRSAKLILEVMVFPAGYDAYSRVDSLQSLIFAGVRITLTEMMNVLGPAIEQARRDLGNSNQNRWLLERCLSLLPFADPPEEGIAKTREILSQIRFFYPHDSRGVVAALGASRCADAMDLLLELAKPDGSAVPQIGDEWITAVAQLGGKRSNEVLLSFVDPSQKLFTKEFIPDFQNGDVLARLLADRAEREDAFKTELFRLANGDLPLGKRGLLARTFAHFRREDLVAGLCVLRDDTNEFPWELLQSIENAFLERRPYGVEAHVYTVAPRGSNALRKRLLEMAQTDPLRKRSAFALLGQIEVWRLEHGRPMEEPRHPAIESGIHWPI
ncbi:MAG: hypothetical protein WCC92_09540 [Candidatus Korobacteraceae bacterium]